MVKKARFNDIRLKIKSWLMQRDYTIDNLTEKGKAWAMISLSPDENLGFAIAMDLDEPDMVGLGITVGLDQWQPLLADLSPTELQDFLYDLRFRLVALNVSCEIPLDKLPSITVAAHLYLEELTRPRFWQTVNEINKAITITIWSLEKKFYLTAATIELFVSEPSHVEH